MNPIKSLLALILALAPLVALAEPQNRLYDFTDTYYLQNGIDPAGIIGRREAVLPLATEDMPFFGYQRNVRMLLTLPAYDHSGKAYYFTVLGGLGPTAFTNTSAGRRARSIADTSAEYLFPKRGTDPVGLGALRQSVVLDMRNGYFSNNKLGLWIHTWVSFTPRALNTSDGRRALDDLARRNGRDLDGTPIIKTVSDIDSLFSRGYVTKTVRPFGDPLRYAICPVTEKPRRGGIAPDQFLAFTTTLDGSPLEPYLVQNFESLRLTGEELH
ncbi:MAG TPA: hypothetical protein VJ696_07950 [Rhodanobacteraceae bacterium]|nr:hypothetical protein [Rhodanobacteraceae bacterium]